MSTSDIKTCRDCSREFSQSEKVHVINGKIVCSECYNKWRSSQAMRHKKILIKVGISIGLLAGVLFSGWLTWLLFWGPEIRLVSREVPLGQYSNQVIPSPDRKRVAVGSVDDSGKSGGSSQQASPPKANIENINATDLCKTYLADQPAAERTYRGRTVELSGVVYAAEWSPNKEEGLFVILETGINQFVVTAWFDKRHEKQILGLRKGEIVRVAGKVGDVAVMKNRGEVFVSLDECVTIEGAK
jgi:hypothetical protein